MADSPTGRCLLILIARNEESFDPLATGLLDVGITGATVVDSKGLGAIIREEMPMFAGLASLLPRETGSRILLSVTTRDRIEAVRSFIAEMKADQRPIGAVLPVESTLGLPDES